MCVDFPGHGESGELEGTDYSVERLAEMTRVLLGRLGIERAVFVGHSLGGMVCLYLGLHYPDAVAGLVLLDTTSHLSGFFFQRLGAAAAVALGAVGAVLWNSGFKLTKAVVAGTAATHPLAGPDPRMLSARECSRVSNKAMTLTLNKARNFNVTPRLGEISAPALIVVGDADLLADVRREQDGQRPAELHPAGGPRGGPHDAVREAGDRQRGGGRFPGALLATREGREEAGEEKGHSLKVPVPLLVGVEEVDDDVGANMQVSAQIDSSVAVSVERSVYWSNRTEGTCSKGYLY